MVVLHDCNARSRYTMETKTTIEQRETEEECLPFFVHVPSLPRNQLDHLRQVGLLSSNTDDFDILLLRSKHVQYLTKALDRSLPGSYVSLDSSRPWIIYWTLHSLDLLDALPCSKTLSSAIDTLQRCFTTTTDGAGGGFGGGPGQMPHCATSYAAIMALCIIGGATTCIDGPIPLFISHAALSFLTQIRCKLYKWLYSLRVTTVLPSNENNDAHPPKVVTAFRVHRDGEIDVRGIYLVIAMCTMLHITTDEIVQGVAEYAVACQTYEGGFGGEPNGVGEAHGGYAYCALATLHLLDKIELIVDRHALVGWIARRQLSFEGGFSGRTNKLVDGCYSFWQGACMALLNISTTKTTIIDPPYLRHGITISDDDDDDDDDDFCREEDLLLLDQHKLVRYILLCAQEISGGLRDKPSKPRDFYHTCYNLSGLSISQHVLSSPSPKTTNNNNNVVKPTHPALNMHITKALHLIQYFKSISDDGDLSTASSKKNTWMGT